MWDARRLVPEWNVPHPQAQTIAFSEYTHEDGGDSTQNLLR